MVSVRIVRILESGFISFRMVSNATDERYIPISITAVIGHAFRVQVLRIKRLALLPTTWLTDCTFS